MEGLRKHTGFRKKEGTKRGHGRRNLGVKSTASVTSCQVRNKDCGLNELRARAQRVNLRLLAAETRRKALGLFQDRFDRVVAYRRLAEPAVLRGQERYAGERGNEFLGVGMLRSAKDL